MTTIGSKYRGTKEYHPVFCTLIDAAQKRHEVTYKQVATILGIHTPGNSMGREVGQILGEISEDKHAAGRPMLSAVVERVDGAPGEGFFTHARAQPWQAFGDRSKRRSLILAGQTRESFPNLAHINGPANPRVQPTRLFFASASS
jgi:hypothetical protein